MVFAVFVMLFGQFFFAYFVGLITNYINNLNLAAALFRDKLARLRAFMEYRQLSPGVQVGLRVGLLGSGLGLAFMAYRQLSPGVQAKPRVTVRVRVWV